MRSFTIFIIILIVTIYSGCGNETSTGNNNPPAARDSLIASFDSLSAANFIAPYYNGFGFSDTLFE
ncbi:MAG: hypothetical protein K8I03_14590 [Ignavibacteria bacterium]|nr:hypothetical protein [Ignavibacteria bacterium]